jgi:hypothetical protein
MATAAPTLMNTKRQNSNISLEKYFDMRFEKLEQLLDAKFDSQEKAIKLAQTEQQVFNAGSQAERKEMREDIKQLEIDEKVLNSRASQNQVYVAWGISIISVIINILFHLSVK